MRFNFKEGQTIWLLEPPSGYRKTPKEYISKCIYRGSDNIGFHNIQRVNGFGLGITFTFNETDTGTRIFSTLEELKSWVIQVKLNDISNLQRSINNINSDIDEIKSLKDISEDRDKKLNTLLK